MHVRDALEADADALAAIADAPTDVMRNLVHDRTVRVAEDGAQDPNADVAAGSRYGASNPEDLLGFVSFDAKGETVHVTQIGGTERACERLLAEPVRFADRESMAVEVLVPDGSTAVERAVTSLGFEENGLGPRFDGDRTTRFRMELA